MPRKWTMTMVIATAIAGAAGVWAWRAASRGGPPTWEAIEAAASEDRLDDLGPMLRSWLNERPDDDSALFLWGSLLYSQGRMEEASSALERVSERSADWGKARSVVGEVWLAEGRAAEAERVFREVAARDPKAVGPRQRLVYLYSLQLRKQEAIAALWDLHALRQDPAILTDLVIERLPQADADVRGLGPELETFFRRDPESPWLRRAWGFGLLAKGRPREALPHLEAAALAIEDDEWGRLAWAECRQALGMAIGSDQEVLGDLSDLSDPGSHPQASASKLLARGKLRELRGDSSAALEDYREAARRDPFAREAHYRLGQALIRRGETAVGKRHSDEAETLRRRESELRRAHERARREPWTAEGCERLARLCRESGLVAEARAWFAVAISIDPLRSSSQSELAKLPKAPPSASPPRLARAPSAIAKANAKVNANAQVSPPSASGSALKPPRFEEVAERWGLRFRYESGARGDLYIGDTMGGGVALFDYDGDRLLDVYFINGGPLPPDPNRPGRNKLFRNLGGGRFEDATERSGAHGKGYGMGCAVGDYDRDGLDDLFLTGLGSVVLYRNRGGGAFEDVTQSSGLADVFRSRPWIWSTAAGFGDLDRDGDLDLFVVCYADADPGRVSPCLDNAGKPIHCSPGAFAAQPDVLLRNDGGRFVDVSQAAGVADSSGRGLGLAIVDADGDGLLDLFVANDGSPDFLYRNQGGLRFEDLALIAGTAVNASGRATASMGTSADDLDGDGLLDLFVANFINEPNSFFKGLGQGRFADASAQVGLSAPSLSKTGFGVSAFDADNDGRLDFLIANGHVDDQPWINAPMPQEPLLHQGAAGGRFIAVEAPEFAKPIVGRGLAAGDLDGDGRVDLVMIERDGPARVWRNVSDAGHWLGVRLLGTRHGSRSAAGAKVVCKAGGRTWTRWMATGTGYLSRHEQESIARFGLGSLEQVDSVEVHWPDGTADRVENARGDRVLDFVAKP